MLEALAAEAGTVMIDEPELSMHVDWQQVLVASMKKVNPDCQLLLATHSPEVMADVPDELVFEL
jgi:predicted ATP-binding protein involved in virulence